MGSEEAGDLPEGHPRRLVLLGALLAPLLPLAACTGEDAPAAPRPPDPDVALRGAAVAREQDLLALYDALLALTPARSGPAQAGLAGLRAEHAVHLAALLPPAAGPSPGRSASTGAPTPAASTPAPGTAAPATPAPAAAPLAAVRVAEAAAAGAHAEAVVPASRGLAALLASLSAAESSHAVALA